MQIRNYCYWKIVSKLILLMLAFVLIFSKSIKTKAAEETNEESTLIQERTKEYEEWKEGLLNRQSMSLRSTTSTTGSVSNDCIAFYVGSDGRFSIGTTGGDPDNSEDNNKKLIYGYPSTGSSYTTFNVDNEPYIYSSSSSTFSAVDGKHTSTMNINGLRVTQELSLVKNASTGREDVVQIKYTVSNPSTETPKMVGVRIMLDTMLGTNDAAPFRIPGYGNLTTEKEFTGDNIPVFWQAFDSLTNATVISQGRFISNGSNNPDKVQFTNWSRVYSQPWGYTVSPSSSNGDSAVSVIWNNQEVNPGQVREYVTYYGLSQLEGDLRPPVAASVYSDTLLNFNGMKYSPDPISVIAYLQNISDTTAKNVTVKILFSDDMKLYSGNAEVNLATMSPANERQVTWKLSMNTKKPKDSYNIVIMVTAENCETKLITKKIQINKQDANRAILVVPGIMGSNLVDKDDPSEKLWLNDSWIGGSKALWKLAMQKINCDYNGNSNNSDIIPLSGPSEYGAKSIYKDLIERLQTNYGCEGVTIEFVPYDWRLGLDVGAETLKKSVDKYDQVSIVAHSMGGLVTEKYLTNYGTSKIINIITAGTPYWGATMACDTLYTGNVDAFPDFVGVAMEDIMRPIMVNFTGIYELLPNKHYTDMRPWLSRHETKYNGFWDFFGHDELVEYNWDKTADFYMIWFNKKLAQVALSDHEELYPTRYSCIMDKVDTTMIVGMDVKTKVKTELDYITAPIFGSPTGLEGPLAIATYTREGDGTVPFLSATMGKIAYSSLNSDMVQKVNNFIFLNGYNHTALVTSETGIVQISEVLGTYYNKNEENNMSRSMFARSLATEEVSNPVQVEQTRPDYQILLAANSQVDVYKDGQLVAYLHENEKLGTQDIIFNYAGSFNGKPVYQMVVTSGDYDINITSANKQEMQCAIKIENTIYSLESLSIEEAEVLNINIKKDKVVYILNGNTIRPLIVIDGIVQDQLPDGMITKEDITVYSMNVRSREKFNNTINPRIKLVNHSDKPIKLNDLCFTYTFNGDGYGKHCFESDWAAVDQTYNVPHVVGTFTRDGYNEVLSIKFEADTDMLIQPNKEMEIHFRIHTPDWVNYDITNDFSHVYDDTYVQNPRIVVTYLGYEVK